MNEELTRKVEDITEEILVLKVEAQSTAVYYICKLGKKLTEAKALLPHGEWAGWLQDKVQFSQRTATDFMRIYKEYGTEQVSLFGGNSQAIANLGYTKALQLLAIPADERESFIEENNVDELSTRQLDELIKERDEAVKRAQEAERIQEQLDVAEARAKKSESDTAIAAEKLNAALAEKAQLEDKLKKLKDNPQIPDELKDKLKAEAQEAAKKEYEKQAREVDERIAQAQAFAEAANADKEKAEAKADELRKKLSMSNPLVTQFKTEFEQVQTWASKCITTIDKLKEEDKQTADKLTAAMTAALTLILDRIKEE